MRIRVGIHVNLKRGGNASRPGGYVAGDVDKHGLLSPNENRAKGNHNIKSENQIQSHHPIQYAWAKKWAKKNGRKIQI